MSWCSPRRARRNCARRAPLSPPRSSRCWFWPTIEAQSPPSNSAACLEAEAAREALRKLLTSGHLESAADRYKISVVSGIDYGDFVPIRSAFQMTRGEQLAQRLTSSLGLKACGAIGRRRLSLDRRPEPAPRAPRRREWCPA